LDGVLDPLDEPFVIGGCRRRGFVTPDMEVRPRGQGRQLFEDILYKNVGDGFIDTQRAEADLGPGIKGGAWSSQFRSA
jgi:hypothetical protein